jgi:hypothetical protein
MADLVLRENLNLAGSLILRADGGKVKIGDDEVLVEGATGEAPPVLLPPPPASPLNDGGRVEVIASLNKGVRVDRTPIVSQGMVLQGYEDGRPRWPGMVLPSQKNTTVEVNDLRVNVKGDLAAIFPSGAVTTVNESNQ